MKTVHLNIHDDLVNVPGIGEILAKQIIGQIMG